MGLRRRGARLTEALMVGVEVVDWLEEALDAQSEGGAKVTAREALALVERLARRLGLDLETGR